MDLRILERDLRTAQVKPVSRDDCRQWCENHPEEPDKVPCVRNAVVFEEAGHSSCGISMMGEASFFSFLFFSFLFFSFLFFSFLFFSFLFFLSIFLSFFLFFLFSLILFWLGASAGFVCRADQFDLDTRLQAKKRSFQKDATVSHSQRLFALPARLLGVR